MVFGRKEIRGFLQSVEWAMTKNCLGDNYDTKDTGVSGNTEVERSVIVDFFADKILLTRNESMSSTCCK